MSILPLAHEAILREIFARNAVFAGFTMELGDGDGDSTTTTSADLIVPEVWADLVSATFTGKVKIAGSSAVIEDNSLEGVPGDTINFPKWNALTDLEEIDEDDELAIEKMGQTDSEAKIKEVGKAVQITDRAALNGLGNAQDEATTQFGELAARKIDADLISVAVTTPVLTATAVGTLTYDAVVDAFAKFGDDAEPEDFAYLAIRSDARAQIAKDDQFIAASQGANGNDLVLRGQIGTIGGVPVIVTDRLPAATAALIKKRSLGLFYKRRPVVETERHARARATDVVTNVHYAVKRVNDNGVCVITTVADSDPVDPDNPEVPEQS